MMAASAPLRGHAPGHLGRASRTVPGRTVRRPGRPEGGTCREGGWLRCSSPTRASAGVASSGPRHCRSVSQLRTRPGDKRPRRRGQPAQTWRVPARNLPDNGNVAVGRMLLGFGFFQPSWEARGAQTVRRWRPFSRRDFRMARPARVDMRLRKPCVLARLRVFG